MSKIEYNIFLQRIEMLLKHKKVNLAGSEQKKKKKDSES